MAEAKIGTDPALQPVVKLAILELFCQLLGGQGGEEMPEEQEKMAETTQQPDWLYEEEKKCRREKKWTLS